MLPKQQIVIVAFVAAFILSSCSPPAQSNDLDLVAASVTVKPSPVHVGDKVVFDHVVRNNGTRTILGGRYDVDFYLEGRAIAFDHATPDILPGRSIPYTMAKGHFNWQPTNTGRYHYRFVVDGRNAVRERIETNNVLEGDIEVLP